MTIGPEPMTKTLRRGILGLSHYGGGHGAPAGRLLGLQLNRAPRVVGLDIRDALVHPVRAALPELDARRGEQIAAPRMRTRDVVAFEALLEVSEPLLEEPVRLQRLALLGSPRRDAMSARASLE